VLEYPYNNFYDMLCANKERYGSKTVVLIDNQKISHAKLLEDVDRFALLLHELGVLQRDRVALIAPNSYEFVVAVFATCKLGATIVPLNTMLKAAEYEYILNDCAAKVLVTSQKFSKEVQALPKVTKLQHIVWIEEPQKRDRGNRFFGEETKNAEVTPASCTLEDLAVIIYTSGTTGNPKGAMLSYKNIFSNLVSASKMFKIRQKDRFIVYLPMFHAFTFTVMTLLPVFTVSSMLIIRQLHPFSNILKQTLLKRVTIFLGVPDIYNALIRAKLPWYFLWFNSIRIFISGGSALSEDTIHKYNTIFKRASLLEGYGLSECSPAVACNPLERPKPYTVGLPLPSYEVKIVDEEMVELPRGEIGEVIVHGDCVMQGYLNHPEITKETIHNGWLRTGDMGKMDDEGYLFIVDRIKDLIISKGINIYPRQIEEALTSLAYVKLAAVVGKSDERSGEVPIAFIELEADVDKSEITQVKVKQDLKEKLANFKIPKAVYFADDMPKTATGKVLKRVLKERLKEQGTI
jgi:long-chain acyl-CoA synthetase